MFWASIKKDVFLVLRDRGALMSLFLLPIIFVAVFGSMFGASDEGRARPVAVWAADGAPRADVVIEALNASGMFRASREASADAVRARVADEEVSVGLIFPADLDPAAGRPGELVIDEAMSIQIRGPIVGALQEIARRTYYDVGAGQVPVFETASPPGIKEPLPDASGFQVSVPGNSVLFGFFLALTVALSFVEERRTGTWRRLLAAPVSRPAILLAKLVPWFLIGLVQMAFLFGTGAFLFGMEVAGSIAGVVLLTCAVVFCATALGLFMASLGGSEKQVGGIGSIVLLVMGLLGGAMVPRLIMPETMQTLGLATPHAWALDGYYTLLIREGSSIADVWRQIVAVTGFGVGLAVLGAALFRFEK